MTATFTQATPRSFNFIGRCAHRGCETILQRTVPGKFETRYTRGFVGVPGSAQKYQVTVPITGFLPYQIYCAKHRYPLDWKRVEGAVNPEHICDSRCTGAKGHSCDCSCGGANHGKDWAI